MFLYIVLVVAFYILANHFHHKIGNLPPTPFPTLPIIGHLHLILKKPLHRTLAEISSKHGPIILLKLGFRRVLVVSSPSAAEECFTKNDILFANRPRVIVGEHLGYNYTSIAWAPYGNHWRKLRKISSLELLSATRLQTLSSIRIEEVRLLIRSLFHNQNQPVEMKRAFYELTLNIMMGMIAGKRYYGENGAEDVEKEKEFREMIDESIRFGSTANILDFLPFFKWLGFGGVEKRLKVLQEKRERFMQDLVEEHRLKMMIDRENKDFLNGDDRKKTMIEVMLSMQESQPEDYKDETIRSLMLILLAAGTETSAGTMEWAMSLLLNNPNILKKAQIEIDNQVGEGCDRLIHEFDLAKLPYLNCIIKETLRLYPAGPLLVPHEPSQECMLGGFRIPRGTMVLVNAWAIQNDPKIWEDPTTFKPERFEGDEVARDHHGLKFMPFGSGRRGCPGEGLAMRTIGFTLASIIQCFEWQRVSDKMVDMSEGSGLVLPMAQPLRAKFRPRPATIKLFSQLHEDILL